jgi:hypothetical protein
LFEITLLWHVRKTSSDWKLEQHYQSRVTKVMELPSSVPEQVSVGSFGGPAYALSINIGVLATSVQDGPSKDNSPLFMAIINVASEDEASIRLEIEV